MKRHLALAISLAIILIAQSLQAGEIEDRVDSLFMLASTPEQHYQHLVDPSREALAEMGETAVPRLVEKLNTDDARERHALDNIFKRIGSPATPYLVKALNTDDIVVLRNTARCLGEVRDKSAGPALVELFTHEDKSIRSTAATSVGKCVDSSAVEPLIALLDDDVESVRKSAAVALGRIADSKAVQSLIQSLSDNHFSVRMTAAAALVKIGKPAAEQLLAVYDDLDTIPKCLSFEVWSKLEFKPARNLVINETKSTDRYMRGFAIVALADIDPKKARKRIKEMQGRETDLFVMSMLEKVTEAVNSGK